MEQLDTSIRKKYGPLVIWKDDLVEIASILENNEKTKIISNNTRFDSIGEFCRENEGSKISNLSVDITDPYISIELNGFSASLYSSSSKTLAFGLFSKIDSILSKRQRKPRFMFSFIWLNIAQAIVLIIPLSEQRALYETIQFSIWALLFTWIGYVAYIKVRRFSLIIPIHKKNRTSFVRRNIDSIFLAIFSATLGAVATKLLSAFW